MDRRRAFNVLIANQGVPGISYVLRDDFTNNRAAGAVNGTAAEPGPGTRAVVDAESKLSIANNKLTFAGGKAAAAVGDPGYWLDGVDRQVGRVVFGVVNLAAANQYSEIGWDANQGATPSQSALYFYGGSLKLFDNDSVGDTVGAYDASVDYLAAVILRAAGAYYAIKGGAFTDWTLLAATATANAATVYPCVINYDAVFTVDNFHVIDLGEPFASDGGVTSGADFTAAAIAELNRVNPT